MKLKYEWIDEVTKRVFRGLTELEVSKIWRNPERQRERSEKGEGGREGWSLVVVVRE